MKQFKKQARQRPKGDTIHIDISDESAKIINDIALGSFTSFDDVVRVLLVKYLLEQKIENKKETNGK